MERQVRLAAAAAGGGSGGGGKQLDPHQSAGSVPDLYLLRMALPFEDSEDASEVAQCAIRRLGKADQAVLAQLLSLEKKLFKKQDNWGDLLIKETQRRNTFLLYAEVPAAAAGAAPAVQAAGKSAAAAAAGAAAAACKGQKLAYAQPHKQRSPGSRPGPNTPAPTTSATSPPAPAVVVGYICYSATGLNAHISKLAVACDWRRRGIARQLVRAAVAAARSERRVCSVSLHVDCDNAAALGLYRGEGFVSEAVLQDYYCRGRHAHKMRLDLDG